MEKNVLSKEEIEELQLKPAQEISEETSILFDRNQPVIRIPTKISSYIKVKRGDRIKIIINKKNPSKFQCEIERK